MNDRRTLPSDWMLIPSFDLEYKQYVLLAYLQRVRARFAEQKLFPHLPEVKEHLDAALELQQRKEAIARSLHGELKGFDPATGNAVHSTPANPWPLELVDRLIAFTLPGMRRLLEEGHTLWEDLCGSIRKIPIGVQPVEPVEGWLLLRKGSEARIYTYSTPWVRSSTGGHEGRCITTHFLATTTVGLHRPYEMIRNELIRRPDAPAMPATYAFEASVELPFVETFLPLAKQLIYDHARRLDH